VGLPVEVHETQLEQPGRNGGRLRRGNRGVRSVLVVLQDMARKRLRKAIEWAGVVIENKAGEDGERPYSVEDVARAAEFLRRASGMDREQPQRRRAPPSFGVVRAAPSELAAQLEGPAPGGVEQKKGPQIAKGLGGTRVAALPAESSS
jgi:hypothetical protein